VLAGAISGGEDGIVDALSQGNYVVVDCTTDDAGMIRLDAMETSKMFPIKGQYDTRQYSCLDQNGGIVDTAHSGLRYS